MKKKIITTTLVITFLLFSHYTQTMEERLREAMIQLYKEPKFSPDLQKAVLEEIQSHQSTLGKLRPSTENLQTIADTMICEVSLFQKILERDKYVLDQVHKELTLSQKLYSRQAQNPSQKTELEKSLYLSHLIVATTLKHLTSCYIVYLYNSLALEQ
jgi:hypothetical protein